MQTDLRRRDLITAQEWTKEEIETLLDVAFQLKRERALGNAHPWLRDKTLAMLFFYSSTRTRASFEAGMAQLGGHAAFIESRTTQIAHGDTPKEIGEILGRYYDGIAIRHCDWKQGNAYIREVAAASRAPVLNMQCDVYHPFQALADLMTIIEKKGDPRGKTIAVSWAYATSYQKPLSVPQSLILLMARFGMNVRLVHPSEFKLMPEIVEQARENARRHGGSLEIMDDFDAGFRGADVVYPKSWGCWLTTEDAEESARIGRKYTDWIADEQRMALAKGDAIYMHCLPADRNIEVTDAVIDGPQSVVYDEAENRLHVQKAAMALTMR
jgi:N-acetylornithine carbamoyltransferase